MNISGRIKSLGAAAALAAAMVASPFAAAGDILIGNDVVDREYQDGWRNFIISMDSEVFPIDGAFVKSWSVYAATTGDLALLIMNGGEIMGVDRRTITQTGLNEFNFFASSGSASVAAGYNVGMWFGSAVVDFDREATNPDGSYDTVRWCFSSNCSPDAPGVGDTIGLTGHSWNSLRQYSVLVVDPPAPKIPVPGTLALLGLGLLGLGMQKHRRK
jgi:hypothetical protein